MKISHATAADVKKLAKRKPKSHKGENGIVLVIAGSKTYHGAAIFAGLTASMVVDLVYFATSEENRILIKRSSPEFVVFGFKRITASLPKVDAVLIGPGLKPTSVMRNMVHAIITRNKKKKFVLDATALRLIDPKWLHSNCAVTPHAHEFKMLFKMPATKESVAKAAKKFNCIVVLKGPKDYISDGKSLFENKTGNSGMTTGGTGDILAGLIAGFAAKNSLLLAAKAGCYLNGYAAGMLQKKKGMWNASDLMEKLPEAKKKLEK